MHEPDQAEIRKLIIKSDPEIIKYLDWHYARTIQIKIRAVKKYYVNTPLESEDLYNIFLFEAPRIVRNYNFSIDFRVYIAIQAYYLARNEFKKYLSKKHLVMNQYLNYEKVAYMLEDSQPTNDLDLSVLSAREFTVLEAIMLGGMPIQTFARQNKLSIYYVRKILNEIRNKLKKQFF